MQEREQSDQMSHQKLPYCQWFVRLRAEKTQFENDQKIENLGIGSP